MRNFDTDFGLGGTKRAAIYTRVSMEEQVDGFSLSAQEQAARQFAAQRGWEVVEVFEERGKSGKSAHRLMFQQMITYAEAKHFDVIVVHKLDRFSRSLADTLSYLKRLNDAGVSLVSVSEDFDFTTPFGKVILAMLAAFAQWYLDNLASEVSKGKKERARKGNWNGQLSFGYTTARRLRKQLAALSDQMRSGTVETHEYTRQALLIEAALNQYGHLEETQAFPDPIEADGVRLAFTAFATGRYSNLQIARLLNERGYRMNAHRGINLFSKGTVEYLLHNRFYIGEASLGKGKEKPIQWIPGAHEPLISKSLFEQCQLVRQQRAPIQRGGGANAITEYPLSKLLVCPSCGLTWHGHNIRGVRRYRDRAKNANLNCTQRIKSVYAADAESQVAELLKHLQLPLDWRARVMANLEQAEPDAPDLDPKAIHARIERLKTLFELGDLNERDYLDRRAGLLAQLDSPRSTRHALIDMERAAVLLQDAWHLWNVATMQERQELARSLFKKIYILDGVIKAIEPTGIMWVLLQHSKYLLRTDEGKGFHQSVRIQIVAPATSIEEVRRLIA